jgi:hypothetical protein
MHTHKHTHTLCTPVPLVSHVTSSFLSSHSPSPSLLPLPRCLFLLYMRVDGDGGGIHAAVSKSP